MGFKTPPHGQLGTPKDPANGTWAALTPDPPPPPPPTQPIKKCASLSPHPHTHPKLITITCTLYTLYSVQYMYVQQRQHHMWGNA